MKVEFKKDYCIASTTVSDINNKEMRQMHEMKVRIEQVLNSHKDEKLKNEYLSDDELKMVHAILSVFTKEYSSTQNSAFDDFLAEQEKQTEKPVDNPVEKPEEKPYGTL